MARPPRIPCFLPEDQAVVYFATLCVDKRERVLDNPPTFNVIQSFCLKNQGWKVLAAVVMPDHLHVLVAPLHRETKITQFSADLKRFVRKTIRADWKWQEGVFDRLLRREEAAADKWLYMRENPVRAGLVNRWEDWPYSMGFSDSL